MLAGAGLFSCVSDITDIPDTGDNSDNSDNYGNPPAADEPPDGLSEPITGDTPGGDMQPGTPPPSHNENDENGENAGAADFDFDFENDFVSFVNNGSVGGGVRGRSINEIRIGIVNNTQYRLLVHLPIGLYFLANSGNVQNMVLTESMSVLLEAGATANLTAAVACMNIYKDIPGSSDFFYPVMLAPNDPLIELIRVLAEHESEFEVMQAAVWHLRDNPGRAAIAAALEYDDGTSAITAAQFDEAVRLVNIANTANIVNERERGG